MRFIEHHHAVGRQQRVQHHLPQQHSVRTELDFGRRTDPANDTHDGIAILSWCRVDTRGTPFGWGFRAHAIFISKPDYRAMLFFLIRLCAVKFFSREAVVFNFRDVIARLFERIMYAGRWDSHTVKLGHKYGANTNRTMTLSLEHVGEYQHQDRGLTKRFAILLVHTLSQNEQSIPLFLLSASPSPLPRELPR